MLTPDYQAASLQLSRDATLIPVAKTLSADLLTPGGRVPEHRCPAEVRVPAGVGRRRREDWALHLSRRTAAYRHYRTRPGDLPFARARRFDSAKGSVIEVAARALAPARLPRLPDLPPFTSGGVGYFAYDMVRQFERLPESAKNDAHAARLRLHVLRPAAGLRPSAPPGAHHRRGRCAFASRRARPTIARWPTSTPLKRSWTRDVRGQHFGWSNSGKTKDQGAQQHLARRVCSQRSAGQGVHRGRRHLPGGAVADVWTSSRPPSPSRSIARCAPSILRPTCSSSSSTTCTCSAHRRKCWCGVRTKAGVPSDRRHAHARRRCRRRRAPDRGSCAPTRRNAPST